MDVRAAQEREIDHLARIWYDGWHEAHAPIVPEELTRRWGPTVADEFIAREC
jgi:hypothetical protein